MTFQACDMITYDQQLECAATALAEIGEAMQTLVEAIRIAIGPMTEYFQELNDRLQAIFDLLKTAPESALWELITIPLGEIAPQKFILIERGRCPCPLILLGPRFSHVIEGRSPPGKWMPSYNKCDRTDQTYLPGALTTIFHPGRFPYPIYKESE